MTDDEIIRLLEARREQAVEALSKEYGAYCRQIAFRLIKQPEDAEEIVNDVWLRVWNSIPPLRPDSLRHYLAKLTRNLAFDLYRKQKAAKRGGEELPLVLEELQGCLSTKETPESTLSAKELGEAIDRFLNSQSTHVQDIFLRRYFYSESITDIAVRYGMREANVRLTLSRTRTKLKQFLNKGGYL